MKKIACVIAAYNEAPRIGRVVGLAVSHPLIDEVIVVDDGSDDETRSVASAFEKARIVSFPENRGKSSAVRAGIMEADSEYVMLLDADLEGLSSGDISELIYPILGGEADMTVSLRKRTAPICYLLGIDYTSWERIFPRSLLDSRALDELSELPGFGLEVFLNSLAIKNRLRIKTVRWRNTFSAFKWAKRGLIAGTVWEIRMRLDIYRTIGIIRIASQIRDMRRLMVNKKRLNLEYLMIFQEIPLFLLLGLRRLFAGKRKDALKTDRVLIADATPLIGEFVASLPAIAAYIRNHPDMRTDILVAPIAVPLARRIRGIVRVFAIYPRSDARCPEFPEYRRVFALRINGASYRILKHIRTRELRTGARHFVRYGLHLLRSVHKRRTPVQWREMNFRMLGETDRPMSFDDIFSFDGNDRQSVPGLREMRTDKRRVIVHTGTNWIMKRWGNGKWIDLLNRLHARTDAVFIFVGSQRDIPDYERISSQLRFRPRSLIGKLDLVELAVVLRQSDCFIGIDSGPGNLAHLCGTPSVHIMGPGPHIYRPEDERNHILLDKTDGSGLFEMFFSRENGYIHRICVDEVQAAFERIF